MAENKKQYKMAIFLMGGGLVNKAGAWRTTNYDEGDKFGVIGDRAIVVAASLLFKDKSGQLLVVLGGKGQYNDKENVPTIAAVIKKELVDLGVPANDILEEKESNNTYQQLLRLQEIWQNGNFNNGQILVNQHGLPRLSAMINYQDELSALRRFLSDNTLKLVPVEEVLLELQPDIWQPIIKKAYASEAMKKRIALEEQGVRQIKDGTYKFI